MQTGRTTGYLILAGALAFVFFEVEFVFDVSLSREVQVPDPAVEAEYQACYQLKDDEIHAAAFGTIDNPDVQKEYISANQARAAGECRQRHPQQLIQSTTPFRFNVVDLTPRFW